MEIKPKQIAEYIAPNNKAPFRTWMDKLKDKRTKVAIHRRITRLRAGLLGHVNTVGDGVHEIKIDLGAGYRVYFANDGDTLVILLCGGSKGTQSKDIIQAKAYWDDYNKQKDLL
jgi:putative addiction module killer protein